MTIRMRNHFDGCVQFLYTLVAEDMRARWFRPLLYPPTVMEAYDAIAFIGKYMGRDDIIRLTEPGHVLLGDHPTLDDIVWVLGEVQKFRDANARTPLWLRVYRWWSWMFTNGKSRYPRG